MSVETAIATAWLRRAPGSKARVKILDPIQPIHVSNLEWGEPETDPEESGSLDGETWSHLDWDIGLVTCDDRYLISSRGRLYSPHSKSITRGFAAYGTRWAACKGAGLVNLYAASGLIRDDIVLPDRVYAAYESLVRGIPVNQHAEKQGIRIKQAWTYFQQAAQHVSDPDRLGKSLVDSDVWSALETLRDDPVLGGKLKPLHEHVVQLLGRDISFDQLRFARVCLV